MAWRAKRTPVAGELPAAMRRFYGGGQPVEGRQSDTGREVYRFWRNYTDNLPDGVVLKLSEDTARRLSETNLQRLARVEKFRRYVLSTGRSGMMDESLKVNPPERQNITIHVPPGQLTLSGIESSVEEQRGGDADLAIDSGYEECELEQSVVYDERSQDSYEQWVQAQSPEATALLHEISQEVDRLVNTVEFSTDGDGARLLDIVTRVDDRFRQAAYARNMAVSMLDNLALIVPHRIENEVIGDYIERIYRLGLTGQSRAKIYAVLTAGVFWTLVTAVGCVVQQLLGRKAA